ncbi:divalent cation tolerance protein CutA [Clostridiaceae bacterium M8S5]|nr:divalent cation tolerance protein CutA [Clostridiaceae bacterium M8S5]
MNKQYKYIELYRYFKELDADYIKMTYDDIEKIIGFQLPKSAYEYKPYWHPSETHTITRSWQENNWKMINVVLGEYIEFKKSDKCELDFNKVVYKIEVYLSKDIINNVVDQVTKLGACSVGAYDHIASYYEIEGCWRPLDNSSPFSGKKNQINYGKEYKLELRCNEKCIDKVLKKIVEIHPYEQPLINVIRLENHRLSFL